MKWHKYLLSGLLSLYIPAITLAAGQTYSSTETWTANSFRTAYLVDNYKNHNYDQSDYVCLGPASWLVKGTLTKAGSADAWDYQETWSVPANGWAENAGSQSFPDYWVYMINASTCDRLYDNVVNSMISSVGLYGVLVDEISTDEEGADNVNLPARLGSRSMPRAWHVEGTITKK